MAADKAHQAKTETNMIDILQSIGIDSYDPRLPAALAECAKRYTAEILADAKDYSIHRGASVIETSDVKLALQTHSSYRYQVQRQTQREYATDINKQELPTIPSFAGMREPIVAGNYNTRSQTIIPSSEVFGQEQTGSVPMDIPSDMNGTNASKRTKFSADS